MKSILHICAGWQKWNGAANIARMIMDEQRREGHEVSFATWAKVRELRAADEVWIHCGWLPCLWWAAVVCFLTQRRRGAECAEMIGRVERVEGESVSQGAPSLRDGAMKSEYSHQ